MQTILFVLEQTILNSFSILLGIAAIALLLGSLLHKKKVGPFGRSLAYSIGGSTGGVLSYVAYDKEPATQYLTVPVLAIACLVVCLILLTPILYFRNKKQRTNQGADGGT